jgi:glycosyltransferase involved in cell wall biosynthesis
MEAYLRPAESSHASNGSVPAKPARQTLTVVIPTKDRAPELRKALASVRWADEIIVVDMHSSDETDQVCAEYPQCRLYKREDYIFGNVNFGFEKATSDWVMRLDTDERVTPPLAKEIQKVLSDPPPDVVGYEFPERVVNLGRELRHGFGRRHFRKMMFRRGMARYPVKAEHEDLETTGPWLRLRQGYLHDNYRSVAHYLEKTNYYTDRDVERADLPDRRPRELRCLIEVARAFYMYYLKLRGYRDGWVGFVDAAMRANYQFVQWAKLRERWERESRSVDAASNSPSLDR